MLSLFIHLLVILLALALAGIIADIAERKMYIKAQRKIKRRKNAVAVVNTQKRRSAQYTRMYANANNLRRCA